MQVQNCMERLMETEETRKIVETYGDTFKYKKKYVETEKDWRRLRRLWKSLEIYVNTKSYGDSGRD